MYFSYFHLDNSEAAVQIHTTCLTYSITPCIFFLDSLLFPLIYPKHLKYKTHDSTHRQQVFRTADGKVFMNWLQVEEVQNTDIKLVM